MKNIALAAILLTAAATASAHADSQQNQNDEHDRQTRLANCRVLHRDCEPPDGVKIPNGVLQGVGNAVGSFVSGFGSEGHWGYWGPHPAAQESPAEIEARRQNRIMSRFN